ncbi:Predicted arabinose efflux permease, MFS family [Arachidicoccus rhizosphaerae]|uniref:Predicted arabinose efflux permease, MFS family n=1 Tax=Arachidicoccus rhizosphaerae TaxID=551991 RepID=A0A1H4CD68_9BACT|nr:MFS transporter [Arachidicoccus rhizosphaerae]SEA58243.1 Predicted arabinose efflux permease, MFS family [Arachidicoccus rhizosphaerae]
MSRLSKSGSLNLSLKITIASYVLFTFFGYLCIGLPLAVLPIFITKHLGYSAMMAGIVISLQYVTTFLTRGWSGTLIDKHGPKLSVYISMGCMALSGVLLYITYLTSAHAFLSLFVLIIARLITGCAEGFIGASPITWAMLAAGEKQTATVISYNGIASYGGIALGATLGVFINQHIHIGAIGVLTILLGLFGYFLATKKPNMIAPVSDQTQKDPISFMTVLIKVAPYGICLMLAGLGFGTISNFITLYYDHFHWDHAALCLSVFSFLFIIGRMFFSNAINDYGGIKVAMACLACETIGLLILALFTQPGFALVGAAVTGFGFSLMFPSLGVEAVKLFTSDRSGAALAAYGLFIDISLGITGPLIGGLIESFGIEYMFSFTTVIVLAGFIYCSTLNRKMVRKLATR